MKACGLVVEYNPLHNGHLYHIQSAKELSNADCIIAVMSGSFLQRGEPAIIDKFHRTRAALNSGVDIVLELPYAYAVQSSDLFARGAIHSLHEIGVDSICFGSESGDINHFISSYHIFKEKKSLYQKKLTIELNKGVSFPRASEQAFNHIGLTKDFNLAKPNNILGYSYVKTILNNQLKIKPLTIKRLDNNYHDEIIHGSISSATSLRKQLLTTNMVSKQIKNAVPQSTIHQLKTYKIDASLWHHWEHYFPLLHYRVLTMSRDELKNIHDVDEGLENRIIATAKHATSFVSWMELLKTKRYTWTRLQRIFTHILTNVTKDELRLAIQDQLSYVRILGFNSIGQTYLNSIKKGMQVPLITQLSRNPTPLLALEEKASNAYYSILPAKQQRKLYRQELQHPIFHT